MFHDIALILGPALSIWQHKEAHRYQDEFMSITRKYYDEYKKDLSVRSDAVLDDCLFKLRVLGRAFATGVGGPNP